MGMATKFTLSAPIPHDSAAKRGVNDMAWLVNITPLGKPVVPEVYSNKATSSGSPE